MDDIKYVNGAKPYRVVFLKSAQAVWCYSIMDEHNRVLVNEDTGEVETAYPFPGNRQKTIAAAKRLARDLGVSLYEYKPGKGFVLA